jgi:hypothetical protein
MDIKAAVSEVLQLSRVTQTNIDNWNFESVFLLSLDVAVLVMKKTSSASKDVNAALVVSVVSEILDQLKIKALSLVDLEKSIEVSQHWDTLKVVASGVLPVVLSYLPHLNTPRSLLNCLSFCNRISSGEEVKVVKEVELAVEKELTQHSKKN